MDILQGLQNLTMIDSFLINKNFRIIECNESYKKYNQKQTTDDICIMIEVNICYSLMDRGEFDYGTIIINYTSPLTSSNISIPLLNPYNQTSILEDEKIIKAITKIGDVLNFINYYITPLDFSKKQIIT